MTNSPAPVMAAVVDIAILALAKRTDPLITRVNEGEILTNLESKQLVHDLYSLASLLKTAAEAVDAAMVDLEAQEKEIALMKVLLGLTDAEKAGK